MRKPVRQSSRTFQPAFAAQDSFVYSNDQDFGSVYATSSQGYGMEARTMSQNSQTSSYPSTTSHHSYGSPTQGYPQSPATQPSPTMSPSEMKHCPSSQTPSYPSTVSHQSFSSSTQAYPQTPATQPSPTMSPSDMTHGQDLYASAYPELSFSNGDEYMFYDGQYNPPPAPAHAAYPSEIKLEGPSDGPALVNVDIMLWQRGSKEEGFACLVEGCASDGKFKRKTDVRRHLLTVHFPKPFDCEVADCNRKGGRGFTRKDHYLEHLRDLHCMADAYPKSPKGCHPRGAA